MTIKIYSVNERIYSNINDLWVYLYQCLHDDTDPVIINGTDGACAQAIGLIEILEKFCGQSGFDPTRITIKTTNRLEKHNFFCIDVNMSPHYFDARNWVKRYNILPTVDKKEQLQDYSNMMYHFGSFVGRSQWDRLWIASWLFSKHQTKTLQTFCSSLGCNYTIKAGDGVFDYLGLEDLNRYGCDILPDVAQFLTKCPITLTNDNNYPLLYPNYMGVYKYYKDIFVDVVSETNVSGNNFWLTEKTLRCILADRPFIIMGSVCFLQNLRKLGFKTFNNWWDESYDDFGEQIRLRMILTVLNTIATWSSENLQKTLTDMKPILEHNKQVAMNFKLEDFEKLLNDLQK